MIMKKSKTMRAYVFFGAILFALLALVMNYAKWTSFAIVSSVLAITLAVISRLLIYAYVSEETRKQAGYTLDLVLTAITVLSLFGLFISLQLMEKELGTFFLWGLVIGGVASTLNVIRKLVRNEKWLWF